MGTLSTYFLANRAWWFTALLVGPNAAGLAGEPMVGVIVTAALVLPALIVFDTDRKWWSQEVRHLPELHERSRVEIRKLTLWSGIALAAGLAIALVRPWS